MLIAQQLDIVLYGIFLLHNDLLNEVNTVHISLLQQYNPAEQKKNVEINDFHAL